MLALPYASLGLNELMQWGLAMLIGICDRIISHNWLFAFLTTNRFLNDTIYWHGPVPIWLKFQGDAYPIPKLLICRRFPLNAIPGVFFSDLTHVSLTVLILCTGALICRITGLFLLVITELT